MSYLRLAYSAPSVPVLRNACLDVYDKELDYIFATLKRLGASPHEIEDLAHELFVVLHRNWPKLDKTRPIRPYLFGVAFRIVSAHRRRRGREIPCDDLEVNDQGLSPEGSLQHKQAAALLFAALKEVPMTRRAVVVMHDLDDIPIIEIARNLSITRFGAYSRLRKGRIELAGAVRRLSKGKTE